MAEPIDAEPAVTKDAFFDGRLTLTQPKTGHRAGTDAVLLAAAVGPEFDGLVVDAGSGVGAVGLGVALACPRARVRLFEKQPEVARLAAANIAANGLQDRVGIACGDLLSAGDRRVAVPMPADLALTNPPFGEAGRVRGSPDAGRRAAHVLPVGATLADWIVACLDLVGANGTLVAIHAAEALADLLAILDRRAGGVIVKCVHPRIGMPARRVLVRATKGSRAPLSIAPPLTLHDGDRFTAEADALHRGYGRIAWV